MLFDPNVKTSRLDFFDRESLKRLWVLLGVVRGLLYCLWCEACWQVKPEVTDKIAGL